MVRGIRPEASLDLSDGGLPSAAHIELLLKGRRSFRVFKKEDIPRDQIAKLLELSNHAPTGGNRQGISFKAVYSRSEMGRFRERFYSMIEKAVSDKTLPEEGDFLANFCKGFRENKDDVLFRNAPHVYFAVGPEDRPIIHTDGVIAATYFELAAFAFGYGALWNGFVVYAINNVPGLRDLLGLGPDEVVCYALCFGIPDIAFQRTVQRCDIKAEELKGF